MTTPHDRWAAAIKAIERHAITQARACSLVSLDCEIGYPNQFLGVLSPKTERRVHEADNQHIRVKMRAIAEQRRRFGYRRIGLMLEREGITMNHKSFGGSIARKAFL